ncbi:hypothetical protein NECAME_14096, partial [Necator americanus]
TLICREPIKAVSCGRVHTVLLTESGTILVAGGGSYGQMGTDEDVRKQYAFRPLPIDANLKFVKIATSFYHSIAITDEGRIFEWGRNPQEVKMRMFVVRRLRMAQLKRMADEEGEEMGLDYQLGHGNKTERSEPHILFDPRDVKWELVACGGNHTIAVSKDGRTFGWGRNDFAQCGVPSDKTSTLTRKYFYQTPKDGSVKRCVSLPDDSVYITKPTLIPEVELMFPNEVGVASSFDQKQLMTHLRTSDLPTLQCMCKRCTQAVSRHFLAHQSNDTKTKCSNVDRSVPIALVHLMSGNVLSAIEQIGRAREAAVDSQVDPALLTVAGLAWEVVANHEDCQSRQILTAAFKCLPITTTQKRSSQLRRLWPMVWNELGVQERISVEEKLDLLQTWIAPTKNVTNVEIPGAALRSASNNSFPRVRVWARCNHVEPAVIGVASSDCNACAEEWTETVRTTLE